MASQPCTITKTLQIAFTPASPVPTNGYIVKWRKVGDTLYNTVSPNPTSSPVNIPAVAACENIEGTIQSNCGGGNTGTVATFFVAGLGFPAEYTLIRTNTCITGNVSSAFSLTGKSGDVVVLKLRVSGAVNWNGTAPSGAGVSCSLIGGGDSDGGSSDHIDTTTSTTGVSAECTITFTMPTDTVTINAESIVNNSTTSSMVGATLDLVSVNGNASTVNASACVGTSGGAW